MNEQEIKIEEVASIIEDMCDVGRLSALNVADEVLRVLQGNLSRASSMSSSRPIAAPPVVTASMNGLVQVSDAGDLCSIGLLVERDGQMLGTLLNSEQARHVAEALNSWVSLTQVTLKADGHQDGGGVPPASAAG